MFKYIPLIYKENIPFETNSIAFGKDKHVGDKLLIEYRYRLFGGIKIRSRIWFRKGFWNYVKLPIVLKRFPELNELISKYKTVKYCY